ncbi:hypothetical protein SLEP1_g48519 [Rubroshorea leprosula]|uniref:Uncharacterized protein n=1 Tax=Rubroshorea leprosula TaxID=152421 RepID=A0AAV5LWR1_9ROSI|nr:hypothetical protein SLEP1_g48519 [Rubroshorea leprosula]
MKSCRSLIRRRSHCPSMKICLEWVNTTAYTAIDTLLM